MGPFFRPGSPRRASLLEPGLGGRRLILAGTVRALDGAPVPGACLDFWHADPAGAYHDTGDRLRGHQVADGRGRYTLRTVMPRAYPGRTRHVHVKVQASGFRPLTTQLYFPGERANARDPLFDPRLVMRVSHRGGVRAAAFDFVLARRPHRPGANGRGRGTGS